MEIKGLTAISLDKLKREQKAEQLHTKLKTAGLSKADYDIDLSLSKKESSPIVHGKTNKTCSCSCQCHTSGNYSCNNCGTARGC